MSGDLIPVAVHPPPPVAQQIGTMLAELAPLLLFWITDWIFGLRPAIAVAVVSILVDAGWRLWRGVAFTRLYLLTSGLVVAFGAVDLWAASPFMLIYEGPITNFATGIAFVLGARGHRPLLQELAEKQGDSYGDTPDIRRFFQLFTLLWAAYFFVKAAIYLAISQVLPMERAMAVRSIGGFISLAVMVGISTQGPWLYRQCLRHGLLPPQEKPASTAQP